MRAYFRNVGARGSGRARPARSLRRGPGAVALRPGARAGAAKLRVYNPQARAARLAVDPYGGRDRQRRHAVPGRQRQRSELNRHGLGIHLIIHPVLAVRRDAAGRAADLRLGRRGRGAPARASSMSRSTGRATRRAAGRCKRICRRVLGDVRARSQDWRAMRGRIDEAVAELEPAPPQVPAGGDGRGRGVPAVARRRQFHLARLQRLRRSSGDGRAPQLRVVTGPAWASCAPGRGRACRAASPPCRPSCAPARASRACSLRHQGERPQHRAPRRATWTTSASSASTPTAR